MSTQYDAIVIGAGHNGLTTATVLAKAGCRVIVVEQRDEVGGLAASEEFMPGYRTAGILSDTTVVRPAVVEALDLRAHGLSVRTTPPSVLALGSGAHDPVLIHGDPERAAAAIGRHEPEDADAYRSYRELIDRLRPAIAEFFDRPPIDIVDLESANLWDLGGRALRVRRRSKADLMELLRLPPMCVADVLGEHFKSDLLKAALALPALEGTFTGPWSPGNALTLLRREALRGPGITGGAPMLIRALRSAAEQAGVEIRTSTTAAQVLVDSGRVHGLELAAGEVLRAPLVAASCHPWHTLGQLLPVGAIDYRLEHHARTFRTRGSVAHVSIALNRPPRFSDDTTVEWARTGAHVDEIERAFDAIKYGEVSPEPILDLQVPSIADPSLAPKGHAVLTATVYFAPHDKRGGWDDAARNALGDRVVELLARHDHTLPEAIVGRRVLTPADFEEQYHLPGGHLFHGEHSVDQLLVRPTPGCSRYRTPLPGLFLSGSGSHPGGGLTCAPGYFAAQAMLAKR